MEQLMDRMKVLLATQFALYLKLHFFHWNVTGPNFPQYHQLFGELYNEVWTSVDEVAERIRTIKGFAPGSFSRFSELSIITDQIDVVPAEQMLSIAIQDNDKMISILTEVYNLSEEVKELGLANYLQDRIDVHKKHAWMLRSTLM